MHPKSRLLNTLSIFVILTTILSSVQLPTASAQRSDGIKRELNAVTGKVSFIGAETGSSVAFAEAMGLMPGALLSKSADPAMTLAKRFAPEFGLRDAERNLTAMTTKKAENGRLTVRYQQNYQGIPVMGGELIVNTNNRGELYSINGEVSPNLALSTQPTIDSAQAKQIALEAMAKWTQKTPEDFVATEPELWIFDESLLQPSTRPATLVWRMDVSSADGSLPIRELVLINAQTGNPDFHFNQIDTAWHSSSAEPNVRAQDEVPPTETSTPEPTEPPIPTETPAPTKTLVPTPTTETKVTDATSADNVTGGEVTALSGTTWYVSTTGSDANDCLSPASTCATINGAINKAAAGDTIRVASGIYTGSDAQVVLIDSKSISLSGGWDMAFSNQMGRSIVDGQWTRRGILVDSSAGVFIDHFSIQNGSSQSGGGGIYNYFSVLTLIDSLVTGNSSRSSGGGIRNYKGTLTINNSAITGNIFGDVCCSGGGGGAGIDNTDGTLTVNNSTISNNKILGGFWGTGIHTYGPLMLNNSTVTNNVGGYGAGIYVLNDTTIINNSTISENQSEGIRTTSGSVILRNTIITTNGSTGSCQVSGNINSQGYNLFGHPADCNVTLATGDLVAIDAKLGKLIGFPGYIPLLPDSPAINAGNPETPSNSGSTCLLNDQRGVVRPVGQRCDIGAYEYTVPGGLASLSIVSGDKQRTAPRLPFPAPLIVAALDSIGSPVLGVNVEFTAPSSGASVIFADTNTTSIIGVSDPNGIVTTSAIAANEQLGGYEITASSSGAEPIKFNLQNKAWFVANNGDDNLNTCSTPDSPCATISSAISKSMSKDTILVAVGSYSGTVAEGIVISNKDLVLSGGWDDSFIAHNGWSTIDGRGLSHGLSIQPPANVVIDRFDIKGSAGEGIYNSNSTLTLNNSIVRDNLYGGVYAYKGETIVNNTSVRNNIGNSGIEISHGGTLVVNNSSIVSNSVNSGDDGGGIRASGTMLLNNSTVSGNTGGLYLPGEATVKSSTISDNQAYGIYYSETLTLQNTIVAGNRAAPDCYKEPIYGNPVIISLGHNLIGNSSSCGFSPVPGDLVNINAKLGLLIKSLGYIPIFPDSPARDAGDPTACPATDQRGVSRLGTCDIGAYEYVAPSTATRVELLAGSPQSALVSHSFATPLIVVVLDDIGTPVDNIAVDFVAPSDGASAVFSNKASSMTILTRADGIASAPIKANGVVGEYSVTAEAQSLGVSFNLPLSNLSIASASAVQTYSANYNTLPGTLLCNQSKPECTSGTDPAADAVHKHAKDIYDFYGTIHHRNSLDDLGMVIKSSVHYCQIDDCPYGNAFWNGLQMVYGDEYGFANADDVAAHELTHGVTQYESQLFYFYQSGAIDESIADLWGEYFDQNNGQGNDLPEVRWLLGEDVTGLGAFRNMKNPPQFGDPDRMTSTLYNKKPYNSPDWDNGGVHSNSGVNNKAVYLMVDGGTFNGKTVTALGWEKTAAVYYEVNTNLLASGSDYSDLYYALQQACSILIGQHGITTTDCIEVKDAIDAVEMNKEPITGFNPDTALCPTGMTTVESLSLFKDDFESNRGDWNLGTGWQMDAFYAFSPVQHMWGVDDKNFADTALETPIINLPADTVPFLHFKHAFAFEYYHRYYFDGGVLEYSLDNGASWKDSRSLFSGGQNYSGIIVSYDRAAKLQGRLAFVGDSHGYVSSRFNLESLAGQGVRFRWRLATDMKYSYYGWFVDDVQINICVGLPSVSVLLAPASNILLKDYTPLLDWGNATSIDHYELQIATDSAFTSLVYNETSLPTSQFQVPLDLDSNTKYYWRARGVNGLGHTGKWTAARTFRTIMLAPTLISPAIGTQVKEVRPLFDWDAPTGPGTISGYTIQIAKDPLFKQIIHTGNPVASQYIPTINLPKNMALHWRVLAKGANGPSAYSEVRSFTTPLNPPPTPILVSPANSALLTNYNNPTLKWKPVIFLDADFQQYQVQVATDNTFSNLVLDDTSVTVRTTGQLVTSLTLIPNTKYYWRVRAVNMDDELSNWSAVRTIRAAVLMPALLTPDDNSTDVARKPLLDWEAVDGSTGYVLQIWKAGTKPILVKTVTLPATRSEYKFLTNLLPNTAYFWKVQTKAANGPSAWSQQFHFTTSP